MRNLKIIMIRYRNSEQRRHDRNILNEKNRIMRPILKKFSVKLRNGRKTLDERADKR